MVTNYDICRVGLEPGTLKALRELVAHVQRPQSEVMNNGNYATIISSRVKRAQVFEYGKPRNLPPPAQAHDPQNRAMGLRRRRLPVAGRGSMLAPVHS